MRLNYTFLFIILILIQILILDSVYLSEFVAPIIYVAFIVLLPTDTTPIKTLLLALLTGLTIDVFSGDMGLNTMSILVAGYTRPTILRLIAGEDIFRERSVPNVKRLGFGNFIIYAFSVSLITSIIFFTFEALDITRIGSTALKCICSSAATTILVYIISEIFALKQH